MKLRFGDKVIIKHGFYKGSTGFIIEYLADKHTDEYGYKVKIIKKIGNEFKNRIFIVLEKDVAEILTIVKK